MTVVRPIPGAKETPTISLQNFKLFDGRSQQAKEASESFKGFNVQQPLKKGGKALQKSPYCAYISGRK